MTAYDVTILRKEYRKHTFRVSARGEGGARRAALEAAGDYNFNDSRVDEVQEFIEAVVPVEKLRSRAK